MKKALLSTIVFLSCASVQASHTHNYIIPEPYLKTFSNVLSGNVYNRIAALSEKSLSQIIASDDIETNRKNKQLLRQAIVLLEYYPHSIPSRSATPYYKDLLYDLEILYNQLTIINSIEILHKRALTAYETFINAYRRAP